jgi:hypothetical protein
MEEVVLLLKKQGFLVVTKLNVHTKRYRASGCLWGRFVNSRMQVNE